MRLLALPLAVVTLVLAACSGGEADDPRALLRATFSDAKPTRSGQLDLQVRVDLQGVPQVGRQVRFGVTGPFDNGEDGKKPRFDFDITLGSQDGSLRAGLVSTGDRGWLKLQGQAYRLSQEVFGQLTNQQATGKGGGISLEGLGVDPESWLRDAKVVGEEQLDGAGVDHLRGAVDVPSLLRDMAKLSERAGALGVTGVPGGPGKLSEEDRKKIAEAVREATVDVWTGADDRRLRRLKVDVRFDVPEELRQGGEGEQRGTLALDLRLSELDQAQRIEPPADARPFSELQSSLAALAAAIGQQQGQQQGEQPAAPDTAGYAECLQRAAGDLKAQQACADLLGAG